ncbi:uncharacterized protein CLUP02_12326 [Colletotrichum lupini]|uniref:Uncharacterized protein n=1 Tax=Colletotrichum lupini TaxID=145971 RepID=A0A9Q8T061_9PEZI|nr:uncharacterized protein CLUP02_12326 [Colletotrichum lupini]UQC86824.1 hypothetical protein CLUP02_12326 [Colletotrichum lupini]
MADAKIKIPRDSILRSSTLVPAKGMRVRKSDGEIGGSSISSETFGITAGLLVDLHYVTMWCLVFHRCAPPNAAARHVSTGRRGRGCLKFRGSRSEASESAAGSAPYLGGSSRNHGSQPRTGPSALLTWLCLELLAHIFDIIVFHFEGGIDGTLSFANEVQHYQWGGIMSSDLSIVEMGDTKISESAAPRRVGDLMIAQCINKKRAASASHFIDGTENAISTSTPNLFRTARNLRGASSAPILTSDQTPAFAACGLRAAASRRSTGTEYLVNTAPVALQVTVPFERPLPIPSFRLLFCIIHAGEYGYSAPTRRLSRTHTRPTQANSGLHVTAQPQQPHLTRNLYYSGSSRGLEGAASTAPSTTAPSTTAPSTTAPSTTAPSTTAPSTTAPSTTAPSTVYCTFHFALFYRLCAKSKPRLQKPVFAQGKYISRAHILVLGQSRVAHYLLNTLEEDQTKRTGRGPVPPESPQLDDRGQNRGIAKAHSWHPIYLGDFGGKLGKGVKWPSSFLVFLQCKRARHRCICTGYFVQIVKSCHGYARNKSLHGFFCRNDAVLAYAIRQTTTTTTTSTPSRDDHKTRKAVTWHQRRSRQSDSHSHEMHTSLLNDILPPPTQGPSPAVHKRDPILRAPPFSLSSPPITNRSRIQMQDNMQQTLRKRESLENSRHTHKPTNSPRRCADDPSVFRREPRTTQ